MTRASIPTIAGTLILAGAASAQVTVGPQVQVDNNRGVEPCNETTIGAAASNPLEIVSGWNDYRDQIRTGIGLSMDGGETWTDFLMRPPVAFQTSVEGDPMTAFDHRTGTIWGGGMAFGGNGGIFVARKDPGAAAFNPTVMARISGSVDKGWMTAGPDPNDADLTRVYIAFNQGLIHSTDMGDTWTAPVPLGSGIGFLPKIGPNGEIYIAYWDFNLQMELLRSFDGGLTVGAPIVVANRMDTWSIGNNTRFPGSYRVPALQALAVDPNSGTLYYVYFDTTSQGGGNFDVDLYFTKSNGQGAAGSWTIPTVVNIDGNPFTGDSFFPWLEVDKNGRLHMMFYDTRNTNQLDSAATGFLDAYYSYSDDGGTTWTEHRLSPNSFSTANAFNNGVFIGDYLGLTTTGDRTLPLYLDTGPTGNADVFTNVITDGPSTNYCFGIACPCGNDDPDRGCANDGFDGDTDTGSLLSASGTNVVANDDLVVSLDGVGAGVNGLVFSGISMLLGAPFGDGKRCVGGMTYRYPVRPANASGVISYGPGEIVSISQNFPVGGPVVAGSTWNYQGWYRDVGGPCGQGWNTSNAISVSWQ